ncbi:MAG TPA: class I SAM-dependent methyltransferase [Methylovirgula sp.]|nr:class I SAM-dependent methyltransferase [Methylovirgula sp.]
MEGLLATWYARNTLKSLADYRATAQRIAANLPPHAAVLEVAPGPGYLAIELAKLGAYRITGLDISQSFVRIATENAARAGAVVDFRQGEAAALPFAGDSFDLVVCRAAFKNFTDPLGALREMHRVLRPGGRALVIDLRNDASDEAIDDIVDQMNLSAFDSFMTRVIFKHSLRKRAYSREELAQMFAATPFGAGHFDETSLGFEIRLVKRP